MFYDDSRCCLVHFTVQFHAQQHQKLSISENDKTLGRHCDVIQNATIAKLSSNVA